MSHMDEPQITHLGMERGKWPVWAFTTEQSAANWACEKADERMIWPVTLIKLGTPMRGEKIPEQRRLVSPTP